MSAAAAFWPHVVYYTSGGRAYHADPQCHGLTEGQMLNDWDCYDDYCFHKHRVTHPVRTAAPGYAAACGTWPCLLCFPPELRVFPPVYNDFGHRPVIGFVDGRALAQICARCVMWTRWGDVGIDVGQPVRWPCTSAKVLGLVPS